MTKYRTATYIGLTPMTFLWGVTDYLARQLQIIVMHTAHLANVSKSVTKNATFPRTGGLPCLIAWQLHVCCISYSWWGTHFLYLSNPPSGIPVPIIPWHHYSTKRKYILFNSQVFNLFANILVAYACMWWVRMSSSSVVLLWYMCGSRYSEVCR